MRTLGIVQARLSSTRLPGKVLLSLGGRSVLERVLDCASSYCPEVLVATSAESADDAVAQECERLGVRCVRGALHDVFSRFALALSQPEYADIEWFYRVTADCPMHSQLLGEALFSARTDGADYLYFADDELPRGLAPELVRRAAFDAIDVKRLSAEERQHVTLPLYRVGSKFRARKLAVPAELSHPELRLTLDYREDAALFEALFAVDPNMNSEQAVRYLLSHPELAALNRHRQTAVPLLAREALA
jgi:spore coat polysaccharide biosynthesis protein SpsF